jgi:membrane protein
MLNVKPAIMKEKRINKPSLKTGFLDFLTRGQWLVPIQELSTPRRIAVKTLRFVSLVLHGFQRHRCPLHAASLTYYSLMAMVPILILALGLARSLGGADLLRQQASTHLDSWLKQMESPVQQTSTNSPAGWGEKTPEQAEVVRLFGQQAREVTDKLFEHVQKIDFRTLGLIGLLVLLWTVIGLLEKIENSFNEIWGVTKGRTLVRKFTDYTSVSLVLPILIVAASSIPVASHIIEVMNRTLDGVTPDTVRSFIGGSLLTTLLPLALGTLMFAFLIGFMPNERVKVQPALIGGFVTMLLFAAWLKICAMLQIGIAGNSMVYGGFAILPILLLWAYTSWQIVLIGAEIAFAAQNRDTYILEQYASKASLRTRVILACVICAEASKRAADPEAEPFEAEAFARLQGIPYGLVRDVIAKLENNHILAKVADEEDQYLLCHDEAGTTPDKIITLFMDDGEAAEVLGVSRLEGEGKAVDSLLRSLVKKHFHKPLHLFLEQKETPSEI